MSLVVPPLVVQAGEFQEDSARFVDPRRLSPGIFSKNPREDGWEGVSGHGIVRLFRPGCRAPR
jgi:hypothetical protein